MMFYLVLNRLKYRLPKNKLLLFIGVYKRLSGERGNAKYEILLSSKTPQKNTKRSINTILYSLFKTLSVSHQIALNCISPYKCRKNINYYLYLVNNVEHCKTNEKNCKNSSNYINWCNCNNICFRSWWISLYKIFPF